MPPSAPSSLAAIAPPRQRRADARPQELLEAGLVLFVEKGFAATRAEEIAARAGVSKGTLYLYYPSKEELLKAVIRDRLVSQLATGAAEMEQFEGPSAQVLREVFVRWWLHVFDSPASGVFKLIITEVRNFPEIAEFYRLEVVEPGQQLIGRVLQRGIAGGEFRRDIDVAMAVQSLLLPMVMLCLHKHSIGACSPIESMMQPQPFIHQHVELILRGLLAQRPPPAPSRKKKKRSAPR